MPPIPQALDNLSGMTYADGIYATDTNAAAGACYALNDTAENSFEIEAIVVAESGWPTMGFALK